MNRIQIPTYDQAPEGAKPALDQVKSMFGMIPNTVAVLGTSPAAINAWLGLMGPLSSTLNQRTRDHISLAVSQVNGCHYCLSAHSYTSKNFGKLSDDEIASARSGRSADAKEDAAATFAKKVIELRGKVSEADLAAVRAAGYSDGEIAEIIGLVTQFSYTNFINNVFDTEIDFPVVDRELQAAA